MRSNLSQSIKWRIRESKKFKSGKARKTKFLTRHKLASRNPRVPTNAQPAEKQNERGQVGTYDCGLERGKHLRVALDLLVSLVDGRHVNRNVAVRLSQRVVDLVRELEDVVLDVRLGVERRQVHILDDRLQVAESVLRLLVSFLLRHLNSLSSG